MKNKNLSFVLGILGGILISIILFYAFWPNVKYLSYNEKFKSMAPMLEKFHYTIKSDKKIMNLINKKNNNETNITNLIVDTLVNENTSNIDSLLNGLYNNILDSLLKIEGYRYIDSFKLDSLVRLMVIDSIEKKLIESNSIQLDNKLIESNSIQPDNK
ncbi:MAG TPA: hypothetical protein PLM87_06110 [Bacteroidales bacterium]|nr:hypothetical protein [Bacteroidales bacterium]